jgi:hypothetical protein
MFKNLLAEMARRDINNLDLSKLLKLTPNTISRKMTGKSEFTRKEMFTIRNSFFPELTIEYLFQEF